MIEHDFFYIYSAIISKMITKTLYEEKMMFQGEVLVSPNTGNQFAICKNVISSVYVCKVIHISSKQKKLNDANKFCFQGI